MGKTNRRTRSTFQWTPRLRRPKPMMIDAKKFGPWIVERDRKVLEALEEYDRRNQKRRQRQLA